ncbi:MAG: hypothetical protein JEY94_09300 [Melioribacteraceae bacterium]|nr:hypothetical protein [Melioribacteraceae bacterium]
MKNKSVSIVASKSKIATVKRMLSDFTSQYPELEISKPKYGNVGDEVLMNFSLSEVYHNIMIEKLLQMGIKVIGVKKEIKDKLIETSLKKNTKKIKTREKKTVLSVIQIEKLAAAGRFNDLFEIIGDTLTYTKDIIERTKELIPDAIKKAIDNYLDSSLKSKYDAAKYIEMLITIASDNRLRNYKFNDLRLKAGEAAVKACVIKERELHYLVKVANNNRLTEIVNYKAFIRLSDLVLTDGNNFKDDLDIAVRDINLRWMRIVADTVEDKFEGYDLYLFRRLFDYIDKHKK